jgi:hypothetical protein
MFFFHFEKKIQKNLLKIEYKNGNFSIKMVEYLTQFYTRDGTFDPNDIYKMLYDIFLNKSNEKIIYVIKSKYETYLLFLISDLRYYLYSKKNIDTYNDRSYICTNFTGNIPMENYDRIFIETHNEIHDEIHQFDNKNMKVFDFITINNHYAKLKDEEFEQIYQKMVAFSKVF